MRTRIYHPPDGLSYIHKHDPKWNPLPKEGSHTQGNHRGEYKRDVDPIDAETRRRDSHLEPH